MMPRPTFPYLTNRRVFALIFLIAILMGITFFLWPEPAVTGAVSEKEAVPENLLLAMAEKKSDALARPDSWAQQPAQTAPDLACRLCHGDSEQVITLPSGEELPVQVNVDGLNSSAHGLHADEALLCTDCHSPADYQYPHQPIEAEDLRAYQEARSETCERCHADTHLSSHPGEESPRFVVCTDCHGAHEVATAASWQEGLNTESCVACHEQAEVPRLDGFQLSTMIRDGLFAPRVSKEYCLACHSQPDFYKVFASGEELSLTIDGDVLDASVHGGGNEWQPLECVDCHEDYVYPHEQLLVTTERGYHLRKYTACARCHEDNYEQALDSAHGDALADGNVDAAVCTDCHGAHDVQVPNEPRERISQTCRQCHSGIYDEYAESVHGDALLTDSNQDVPTCIDCHGVHNIAHPTTNLFRIRSPQLCAGCHADENLMGQYEISTEVFDTYVADFHGTTVTLFEHQDPTVETNKAVCYDCHGVHDIKHPDDPEAGIKANLLETCQRCHPDANENFPNSWTSHFQPSLEHNPLVYGIELFYRIVIPLTVGFFAFMVATDIYRRIRLRLRGGH